MTNLHADYSNTDGSVSGNITLSSVEQLYAGVGDGSLSDASGAGAEFNTAQTGVRLAFSSSDTGYGYIAAGSSGADTITLATSTVVGSSPMTYGSLSHTIGSDILGSIIFAGAGADNITGTCSGDIIFGGADNDTIDGGGGTDGDLIFAGSGDDGITVDGTATVFGGAGADTLTLDASGVTADVDGVETVTGGTGNDAITMISNLATGNSIDLASGSDTMQLSAGTNTGTISNVETVLGTGSADTLTLEGTVSGTTFAMGGGTDTITLADGGNSTTVQNTETVNGGSGADTITTSGSANVTIFSHAGNDILNLTGSGTHSIDFDAAASNGTDTITGFNAGASGDVLHVDTLGLNGAGTSTSTTTSLEILTGDAALTSGTSVVVFDDAFYSGVDSTVTLSTQVTNFLSFLATSGTSITGSLSAGDKLMLVIDDSTAANDISLWHWDDASADGIIDSAEITDVGIVDNTDISNLAAANFA